jgi:hypothetical protein
MNWKDEILKSHKGQSGFFKQIEEKQKENTMNFFTKTTENKIFGKEIIFEDLSYNNTTKLFEVQIKHDDIFYTFNIDIESKESFTDIANNCKYLGETDNVTNREVDFNTKLTKIVETLVLSYDEKKPVNFGFKEIKIIEEFINVHLSDYPEIYEDL